VGEDHTPAVRPAGADDVAELVRLAALARTHVLGERGGDTYLRRESRPWPTEASFRADVVDPGRLVLIGSLGPVPFGYAVVSAEPVRGGRLAVVGDLFVEPGARGVGLGRLLMDRAVGWAEAHGCVGIDAAALPGDRESKNFFEAFGLVARLITVHRVLGEGSAIDPSDEAG
jgi:GNAT superfamily N-acetyltransferase